MEDPPLLSLLAVLTGVILAVRYRRRRRLERVGGGELAEATVRSISELPFHNPGLIPTFWRVRYAYRDQAGVEHQASTWSDTDPRPCPSGFVRYDPKRPGDSLWLGTTRPEA